ncbi:Topoisomerase II-associated protein PAT1, putative isoform 1 [Hibiscus syriacus]|uniref:carnosine N-methyltransferase n=1 Tax=Hibiscus syriacus TaxID=106335 RepID=A0A6A2XS36_HIBSY|nr:Topoisomerase II-associated protein PAT1, putative isoform 1 [Hibiscus syriacus]
MSGEIEEDEERRRQRKLEEALEVKSLRRIISAYLNYPEAAEEDVRRYERSFKKLQPAHKALLPHYPSKFQNLRRCISMNSYFIFSMLQAFEPPLDMSHDVDGCEDPHPENIEHEHCHSEERNASSCCSASTSGRMCCSNRAQACSQERNCVMSNPTAQEVQSEYHQHVPISGSSAGEVENNKDISACCGNDVFDCNGNMFSSPHDWLDPSLQLNVPLVDVDKGMKERDQCFKPILEELDALFPNRSKESPPTCLVPGAGLGRLALEISCLGPRQLDNGQYILGSTAIAIHVQTMINFVPFQYQIFFQQGITEGFSMCGGDFVEVYNDSSQIGVWDAVVTCFFIDTAHNIIEYIEIISRILKEGGVWINFGPLLYHFADIFMGVIEPNLSSKKLEFEVDLTFEILA